MLTWTPDPAESPWHEVQEDEVWANQKISAVDPDGVLTIVGYRCEIVGGGLVGLNTSDSADGMVISAPASLLGSFPVTDLEYQIKGVTGHCDSFNSLPESADEIIRYAPNPAGSKEWTLRVFARDDAGDIESAEFLLKVYANFTTGANALKEAINARSH